MCINEKKCINKQVGGGILDCSESEERRTRKKKVTKITCNSNELIQKT